MTAQRRRPPDWRLPRLHPSYARMVVVALNALNTDPVPILAAHRYSVARLEAARLIPFALLRALVRALPGEGGNGMGLEIGARSPVTIHGSVGPAMVASAHLDEALGNLARFGGKRGRTVRFASSAGPEFADLELIESFDFGDIRNFVLEAAVVHVVKLLGAVIGQEIDDFEYEFPYEPPAWASRYANYLKGKVAFGAGAMRIRIPRAHLALRGVSADSAAKEVALRQCEREGTEIDLAARRDLLPWIRNRLDQANGDYPSLEAMAKDFGLSSRTLIRKLNDKGIRYRDLIDEARAEMAGWQLTHTQKTIEQIAVELGYGDPSNFSRTFRRWRGQTPSEFRRRSRV